MTTQQYLIPGWGYINETTNVQYLIPGWGYINETQITPVPPPTSGAIIEGLVMINEGLTILSGLTTNLIKGLVKDELNLITRL